MGTFRQLIAGGILLLLSSPACNAGSMPPVAYQGTSTPLPPVETAPSQPPEPTLTVEPTTLVAPEQPQILLTVGGDPTGETIRPLLGVGGGPLPSDRESVPLTEQYRAIGVTLIRTHDLGGPLDMAVIYPDQTADPGDPDAYDFAAGDRMFTAILEGGFEPYLRLGDSMNAAPGTPALTQRAPVNPDNWILAAVEVVGHYEAMSRQAGIPLRYVEIWNEPNHRLFWDGSPREFYDLFVKTAEALKAAFPDLLVGGPALACQGGEPDSPLEQYTSRFLDYLQQRATPLDFLSWHLYSSDATAYVRLAAFYREQLDAHGYTAAATHITEWNTAMQGEDESDAVRNTSRGAALMSAAWIGLQESDVALSTFYRGNEQARHGNMGLFRSDGSAKPLAWAFSLWARMAAHPRRLPLTLTGGSDPRSLWALAGQDDGGEVAVLIVNTTDTPTSWRSTFSSRDTFDGVTLYQVSDAAEGVQTFPLETPAAEIGAYAVQLLVVNL